VARAVCPFPIGRGRSGAIARARPAIRRRFGAAGSSVDHVVTCVYGRFVQAGWSGRRCCRGRGCSMTAAATRTDCGPTRWRHAVEFRPGAITFCTNADFQSRNRFRDREPRRVRRPPVYVRVTVLVVTVEKFVTYQRECCELLKIATSTVQR